MKDLHLQVPGSMVNTVGKNDVVAIRAYLAGLIDADGAIMAIIEPHKEKRFRFRVRVVIKVTQHQPEVLEWLLDTFGAGKVVINRTAYDWIIRSQKDALVLLTLVSPYLRVKSKQAKLAKEILGSIPTTQDEFLQIVRKADALSKLNVRSTNRRLNTAAMVQAAFSRND